VNGITRTLPLFSPSMGALNLVRFGRVNDPLREVMIEVLEDGRSR
jgi:hypothetical protein